MMKRIAEGATRIFLACGYTDFRKQIPGLVASVTLGFKLDSYNGDYVFIFCNRKRKCHFQKAAVPVPPLAYSISTPSLIAQIMYQKFAMGLPLARQEKDWFRLGLVLSRSNMANWIIRCSQEWLGFTGGSMRSSWNADCFIWMKPGSSVIRKKENFLAVNPLCG